MVEHHSGRLPASYQQLLALPGIGEYTAGAIASIAYQIPVPAVDGNVLRVMTRLLGCQADIAQPRVRRTLRTAVEAMLPDERPGDTREVSHYPRLSILISIFVITAGGYSCSVLTMLVAISRAFFRLTSFRTVSILLWAASVFSSSL